MTFGPFAAGLDPAERLARTRVMRALAVVFACRHRTFIAALCKAETDPAALTDAFRLLEQLPSLIRRRLLATYAHVARPNKGD